MKGRVPMFEIRNHTRRKKLRKGQFRLRIAQLRKNMKTPPSMPVMVDDEMLQAWLNECRKDLEDQLGKARLDSIKRHRPGTMVNLTEIYLAIYGEWMNDWWGDKKNEQLEEMK
jgi:hypothetical protein